MMVLISLCPIPEPAPDSTFSFVFISHLTNFPSYSVFMYIACFFLSHFAFEKEPARFQNVRPLTFILHLHYRVL